MKIPIITATEPMAIPPVTATTRGAGREWEAVGELSGVVSDISNKIAEKQTKIRETIQLAELEADMQNTNEANIINLRKKPNPDTYFSDWNAQFNQAAEDRLKGIKAPKMRAEAQVMMNRMKIRELVEQKHYGNVLFIETMDARTNRLLAGHVKRGELKEGLELIEEMTLNGIYHPNVGQRKKEAFEKDIENEMANRADVSADQAILNDPVKALEMLQNKNYLPELKDKQRMDKVKKATEAVKVWEYEQEKKKREADKIAHDTDEKEIGDLYLAKNYTQVYTRAQSSKVLTGDEKKKWGDAAENAAKQGEKIDPIEEAQEYAFINNLMAKGVDSKVIKDSIIITPRLDEGSKKKLLDRLERQQDKEINRASQRAYEYMKREIVSPTGIAGVIAKSIPEDTRAANYTKAQLALDDWVDKQVIGEKPITSKDIIAKAEELIQNYKPKMITNPPIIQKKTDDMVKALNELGNLSKPQEAIIPKTEIKRKAKKYKSIESSFNPSYKRCFKIRRCSCI